MDFPNTKRLLFAAFALMCILSVVVAGADEDSHNKRIFADAGSNVTLPCASSTNLTVITNRSNVVWILSDTPAKESQRSQNSKVHDDGSLHIWSLTGFDSHTYTCQDPKSGQVLASVDLVVRTPPPSVSKFNVITHSVYALVTWSLIEPEDSGGYPVTAFNLSYREDMSRMDNPTYHWNIIDDIRFNTSSITIFSLKPNTTYYFRLTAVNRLGSGPMITKMAKTKFDPKEIHEAKEIIRRQNEESESTSIYMKVTIIGVCLVLITFATLAFGISLVLIRNCGRCQNRHTELRTSDEATEEDESLELVPHITLNPSFNIDMLEYLEVDASPSDVVCERTSLVQAANESSSLRVSKPNG